MTTLQVKSNSVQSRKFLEYASTLPYVTVVEEQRRFKPEVEKSLRESERGEGLTYCEDVDDLFNKLGLKYAKTRLQKQV